MDDTEHNTDPKHIIDSLYNSDCPRFCSRIPQRCSRNTYLNQSAASHDARLRSHRSEVAPLSQSFTYDKGRFQPHSSAKAFQTKKCNEQPHKKLVPFIRVPVNRKPQQKQVAGRKQNGSFEKPNNKFREDLEVKRNGNRNNNNISYGKEDHTMSKNELSQAKHLLSQKQSAKKFNTLPDQATIKKHDDLEVTSNISSGTNVNTSVMKEMNDTDELNQYWEEKIGKYNKMKKELQTKQGEIVAVYANLRDTHSKISKLGQDTSVPLPHDLRILNIGNEGSDQSPDLQNINNLFDMTKLRKTKENIISALDHSLTQRQDIIDWLQSLLCQSAKGIKMKDLIKKIHEVNIENNNLNTAIQDINDEFSRDVDEIASVLRRGINDTKNLQLKTEDLTYEISELNSRNTDLQKQLQTHMKRSGFRGKEALENELKDEKCKQAIIRERLAKAEAEAKSWMERSTHLEELLNATQADALCLNDNVNELREQNQNLQSAFDSELNKLTESVQENSVHIKEIGDARQKLQEEKEEMEAQISELTENFNKTISQMQTDQNQTLEKLYEAEKQRDDEMEEKNLLQQKIQTLTENLEESELLRQKLEEQLKKMDADLREALNLQTELDETLNNGLGKAKAEVTDLKNKLEELTEVLKAKEECLEESFQSIDNLKKDNNEKEIYINDLEQKINMLETQLEEGQIKIESYNEQLLTVKDQVKKFKDDLGDYESLKDLRQKVQDQRDTLDEVVKENHSLNEQLSNIKTELSHYFDKCNEQTHILEDKSDLIKELAAKEMKHSEIINQLSNELSIKTKQETDVNQRLLYKDGENKSLLINLEKRKQQILQLEEIIHALEDQFKQTSNLRQRDQAMISELEKKIDFYQKYISQMTKTVDEPVEHVESIMRIFEDELGTGFDKRTRQSDSEPKTKRNHMVDVNKSNIEKNTMRYPSYLTNTDKFESKDSRNNQNVPKKPSKFESEHQNNTPEKIVQRNSVRKTCALEIFQNERQSRISNNYSVDSIKEKIGLSPLLTQSTDQNRFRNVKQSKMLQLACHRI